MYVRVAFGQRLSFDMHEQLATELQRDVHYRRLTCAAVSVAGSVLSAMKPSNKKLQGVEWVDTDGARSQQLMGDESTIAQVHPRLLTEAMLAAARATAGTELMLGCVEDVLVSTTDTGATETRGRGRDRPQPRVEGVIVNGEPVHADRVVLAAGPWTHTLLSKVRSKVPKRVHAGLPPVLGQKYHSVLMRPQSGRVLSQAVFFQGLGDPEAYPRPDGEVYITGFPDAPGVVEEVPGEVEVRGEVCDRLQAAVSAASSEFQDGNVVLQQACHLPLVPDGTPMFGRLPGLDGAYVATGHSCWGILNSPGTGLAMAELIVDGEISCIDPRPFDPSRFL